MVRSIFYYLLRILDKNICNLSRVEKINKTRNFGMIIAVR